MGFCIKEIATPAFGGLAMTVERLSGLGLRFLLWNYEMRAEVHC